MAKHYTEEYLVSLGFDLNSKEAQDYLKISDEIEKKQQAAAKAGKSASDQEKKNSDTRKNRMTDSKKEINLMGDMEKSIKKISAAWATIEKGDIFGTLTNLIGPGGVLNNGVLKSLGLSTPIRKVPTETPEGSKPQGGTRRSSRTTAKTAETFTSGKEQGKGIEAGTTEQRGLEAGITGVTAGEEGAGGEAAAGGAAAGISAAVPLAIAAAAIAAGAAIFKMSDNLSQANIQVESMAKQMWITDSAAWSLNNTLSAMGKTTGDLNNIALNPILKNEFEQLQQFQQQELKLPADFEQTNTAWANGVDVANAKLKMSLNYMKELTSYKLEKIFGPAFESLLNGLNGALDSIIKLMGGNSSTENASAASTSATASSNASNMASYLNGTNYAPNSASYQSNSSNTTTMTNQPTVNVYTNSNDPQTIGNTAAGAVQQSFSSMATIKSLQSIHR